MSTNESLRPTWIQENLPEDIIKSDLFRFKIQLLNGNEFSVDIANDVEVDYDRLEEQMDRIPGQYTFWAAVYSELKCFVSVLEQRIRVRRGILVREAVETSRAEGVKLTDKQITSIVDSDDKLQKWEFKLAKLQRDTGKLWHMIKAIEIKSDMLRSRAGFKRQELELKS